MFVGFADLDLSSIDFFSFDPVTSHMVKKYPTIVNQSYSTLTINYFDTFIIVTFYLTPLIKDLSRRIYHFSLLSYLEPEFILTVLSRVSKHFEGIASDQAIWRIRIARRWPAKFPPVDLGPEFSW